MSLPSEEQLHRDALKDRVRAVEGGLRRMADAVATKARETTLSRLPRLRIRDGGCLD